MRALKPISFLCTAAPHIFPFSLIHFRSADTIATNRSVYARLMFGERCFTHAGPKAGNELSTERQNLTDHSAFRRQLKTFLFELVFTTQ